MAINLKTTTAARTTITRDVHDLEHQTGNIYESLFIIAKRANQISGEIKEELGAKLQEFASHSDNLEEIFENREQIEISRHYEKLPKSVALSIDEFVGDRVYFRKVEDSVVNPRRPDDKN